MWFLAVSNGIGFYFGCLTSFVVGKLQNGKLLKSIKSHTVAVVCLNWEEDGRPMGVFFLSIAQPRHLTIIFLFLVFQLHALHVSRSSPNMPKLEGQKPSRLFPECEGLWPIRRKKNINKKNSGLFAF